MDKIAKRNMPDQDLEKQIEKLPDQERDTALEMFGFITGISAIAKSIVVNLSAQQLRALTEFKNRGLYRAYGYSNFADFLDQHPKSPMRKSQYFDRLALLEKEGDAPFDLLNEMGISLKERRLLPGEVIKVDGDEIIVGEKRVDKNNFNEVKELIRELAQSNKRLEIEQKELASEVEKLKENPPEPPKSEEPTPEERYRETLTKLYFALQSHISAAQSLTMIERERLADHDLDMIRLQLSALKWAMSRPEFDWNAANDPAVELTRRPTTSDDIKALAERAKEMEARGEIIEDDYDDLDEITRRRNVRRTNSAVRADLQKERDFQESLKTEENESPLDQQTRLHREAVREAQARDKAKFAQNEKELADLM